MAKKSSIQDVLSAYLSWAMNNSRTVMIAGALACAGGASLYFFLAARSHKQAQAFAALHELLEDYSKTQDEKEALQEVASVATAGQQQFDGTISGMYFDLVGAQLALREGDVAQAQQVVSKIFNAISRDNPLYTLVATLHARMLLDADSVESQQQGQTLLQQLADDKNNKQRDVACYYLASWYQEQGDAVRAQPLLEVLALMKAEKNDDKESPWSVAAAQELVR